MGVSSTLQSGIYFHALCQVDIKQWLGALLDENKSRHGKITRAAYMAIIKWSNIRQEQKSSLNESEQSNKNTLLILW